MLRQIITPILFILLINMPVGEIYASFTADQTENAIFAQVKNQDLPLQLQPRKQVPQPIRRPDMRPLPNTAGQNQAGPQQQDQNQFVPQQQDPNQFIPQDPNQFVQTGQDQYQQGQPGIQGTPSGSQGVAPGTSDMQRRTGGQGRTNAPGGQQMPMGQQPMQQGGQQMPMGQQTMQPGQQGMPQQQDSSSMQMQQPGGGQPMMQQGGCKIQLSEDRTSIALIDPSGQETEHVSLGQDRVQKIFKSPDGNWHVVVFKVRQRQEFGAIAINMVECDAQETRDIRAMPVQIEFQGSEMVLMYQGNASERSALSNKNRP